MAGFPKIAIVGAGKVGAAIGILAARTGYRVAAVADQDRERAEAVAKRIGRGARACDACEAARAGELVLLTVPDDAIKRVCAELAKSGAFEPGAVVAHCSGALDSSILSPARDLCGCAVGSMHPLHTFPSVEAALQKLPGAFAFCEGDDAALTALERFAKAIGLKPVRIEPSSKALYHAAAVMACNCLTALMDASMNVAERAGLGRELAWAALEPLVRATIDNIAALGTEQALTGPIARGDVETVGRHLKALSGAGKEIEALYRVLGKWTTKMALHKGAIDQKTAKQIRDRLRKVEKKSEK